MLREVRVEDVAQADGRRREDVRGRIVCLCALVVHHDRRTTMLDMASHGRACCPPPRGYSCYIYHRHARGAHRAGGVRGCGYGVRIP